MPRQTTFARTGETPAQWHLVDASGKQLGRMAVEIASILMGKHRPDYTPHVDTGDYVVLINATQVRMHPRRALQKERMTYSSYPGGQRRESYARLFERRPEFLIEETVRRMLPKSRLGKEMLKKLKIYTGTDHPHRGQQPQTLELVPR